MRTTGSARALGALAEHRAGDLVALDELLAQHVGVVARGELDRVLHLRVAGDLGDADRRALARRLDDQRQAEHVGHRAHAARAPAGRRRGGRSAASAGPRRARPAWSSPCPCAIAEAITPEPVYGNAEQLERALHAAVLAVAAVQRDEAAREAFALELGELALGRIEGVRVDALRLAARRARRCPTSARSRARPSVPPISTATLPSASTSMSALMRRLPEQFDHLRRHVADRAGAHRDHHVAGAAPARRSSAAIAAMSSTNTGSTLPATRSARASARPSAATIGASPAA